MNFESHAFLDEINRSRQTAADKPAADKAVRDYLDARTASYAPGNDFDAILRTSRIAAREFRLPYASMAEYDRVIETCRSLENSYPLDGYVTDVMNEYSRINGLGWNKAEKSTRFAEETGKLLRFKPKRSA